MENGRSGFLGSVRNRANQEEEPLFAIQQAPAEIAPAPVPVYVPAPSPVYAPPPLVQFATPEVMANLELPLAVAAEPPRVSAHVQASMERMERLPSPVQIPLPAALTNPVLPPRPSPVNDRINQQITTGNTESRSTPERLPNASTERIANQPQTQNPTSRETSPQQNETIEPKRESNMLLFGGLAVAVGIGAWWYFRKN